MARTQKVARRSAAREATVAKYLDVLLEFRTQESEMAQWVVDSRFESDCMAEALKRFRTDYSERTQ